MSALHTAYLADIIEAHREGLRVLRELIATATDPAERRRLAIALVRARPVKDPEPDEEAPPTPTRPRAEASAERNTADSTSATGSAPRGGASQSNPQSVANPVIADLAEVPAATAAPPPTSTDPGDSLNPLPPPPPGFTDCTHPALPPYPGMQIKELLKRAAKAR